MPGVPGSEPGQARSPDTAIPPRQLGSLRLTLFPAAETPGSKQRPPGPAALREIAQFRSPARSKLHNAVLLKGATPGQQLASDSDPLAQGCIRTWARPSYSITSHRSKAQLRKGVALRAPAPCASLPTRRARDANYFRSRSIENERLARLDRPLTRWRPGLPSHQQGCGQCF
jgi:hypothetical protein